jgi:hypothetical protein
MSQKRRPAVSQPFPAYLDKQTSALSFEIVQMF